MMSKEEFDAFHKRALEDCREIFCAKNADYAPGEDPFANFRLAGMVLQGFLKEEYEPFAPMLGLMIRSLDKFQRQRAFMLQGLQVDGEGIRDACLDPVNYNVILAGLFDEYEAAHRAAPLTD